MKTHAWTSNTALRKSAYVMMCFAAGLLTSACTQMGQQPRKGAESARSLVSAVDAASFVVEELQITVSSANETSPKLGNDGVSDLLVFTMQVTLPSGSLAPGDIWYQRIASDGTPTGPATQVTAELTDDQLDDVSGDYLVYTAFSSVGSTSGSVMLHRISTFQTTTLASADNIGHARIHGGNVVWMQGLQEFPEATQVMWYELGWLGTSRQARVVAGPFPSASEPVIGSGYIAWKQQYSSGQSDIWAFDLENSVRFQVTDTSDINESHPATSGPWIVWQAQNQGSAGSAIEAIDPATSEQRTLVSDGAMNLRPSIDGGVISWESTTNGNLDIYLYRMSDGETLQLTTDPADQYLADVFGNRAAWVDKRNGSEDIYVGTFNRTPVADAGPDQSVSLLGATVQMNGSTSYDPDGDAITYKWSFTYRPAGSSAELSDPTSAMPTFIADKRGQYDLSLTVTDPFGASSMDAVTVSYHNVRPVANAGVNQIVVAESTVHLDGGASSDANGDILTYQWTMSSRPDGSSALLTGGTTSQPSFVADLPGQYVVSLTVSDGVLSSDPSTVTITAITEEAAAINILRECVDVINELPPASFKNPNMANALTNKIAAAVQMIDQDNEKGAVQKLTNDVMGKTDGCAKGEAPDKNDWIMNCTAQQRIYWNVNDVISLLL